MPGSQHYYSYSCEPESSAARMRAGSNLTTARLNAAQWTRRRWSSSSSVQGEYQDSGSTCSYSSTRTRSWNAYMLFYERVGLSSPDQAAAGAAARPSKSASLAEYVEGRELKTPSPRSGVMQRVESLVSLGTRVFADAVPATANPTVDPTQTRPRTQP